MGLESGSVPGFVCRPLVGQSANKPGCPRRLRGVSSCASSGAPEFDVAGKSILALGSQAIGDSKIQSLISAILDGGSGSVSEVEQLSLDGNSITSAGARALAEQLLPRLPNLSVLSLWNNEVGDDGAVAIAKYLEDGAPELSVMNLASNAIGNEGGAALGRAVGSAQNLQVVYLMGQQRKSCSVFGRAAAEGFADGLNRNSGKLWFINLEGCGLNDEDFELIKASRKGDLQCVYPVDPHPRVGGRPAKR